MRAITARALSELLSMSERAVRDKAARESWPFEEESCRGGKRRTYPLETLPPATREAIASALMAQDAPAIPDPAPVPVVQAPADPLGRLTAHQRETALARLAFVREIDRAAAMIGKEKAIRNLLKALENGSLAPRLAELVHVANDRYGDGSKRGPGLSRRRLYEWCSLFASGGEAALAPRHQGKDMRVPAWANAFLAIWQRPQKPTIADAYRQFTDEYTGTPPSIFAIRRWLDKMAAPERDGNSFAARSIKSDQIGPKLKPISPQSTRAT